MSSKRRYADSEVTLLVVKLSVTKEEVSIGHRSSNHRDVCGDVVVMVLW